MKIVIVDQECRTRKVMEELITDRSRYQIVGQAENGLDGLALINGEQPDLVITDIDLPKLDGLEMIHQAKGRGGHQNFVIVSGSEDFSYIRKAICYGVKDYLLKPINPKEVEEMLTRMEGKFAVEKENYELFRKSFIKGMLTGERSGIKNNNRLLELCGFKQNKGFTLLGISVPQEDMMAVSRLFERVHVLHKEYSFYHVLLESDAKLYCIYEGDGVEHFLSVLHLYDHEHVLQGGQVAIAAEEIDGIERLFYAYCNMRNYYEYQMVFEQGCLITREKIATYHGKEYRYPKSIENQLLRALIRMDQPHVMSYGTQFIQAIKKQKICPKEIRHAYIKILTAIWSIMQEMSPELFEKLQSDTAMQKVITAVTMPQLERIFYQTLSKCLQREKQNGLVDNSMILRAISFIREHYQEGITLNEVANQLGITPEYLSFLFTKEVGDSFTTFLKKFRISHAKRLLKFSNKKVYEISADLGYADSKYFSRVFKQEVGITPAEYRQLEEI